jgi:monofunctional biosynthetic peptidoglycan transglycosylase
MEEQLSKGRILELYLNVVELGPRVHGVGAGARYHFGKNPAALTAAEGATLAAILPGPRIAYNPKLKPEKVRRRAAHIIALLEQRRALAPEAAAEALRELRGESALPPAIEEELAAPERDEEVLPAAETTPPPANTDPVPPPPEAATEIPRPGNKE